jgi:hypothetical protein
MCVIKKPRKGGQRSVLDYKRLWMMNLSVTVSDDGATYCVKLLFGLIHCLGVLMNHNLSKLAPPPSSGDRTWSVGPLVELVSKPAQRPNRLGRLMSFCLLKTEVKSTSETWSYALFSRCQWKNAYRAWLCLVCLSVRWKCLSTYRVTIWGWPYSVGHVRV